MSLADPDQKQRQRNRRDALRQRAQEAFGTQGVLGTKCGSRFAPPGAGAE